MATLSVLKFATAEGAEQMQTTLLALQKQQLITIQDAAIVTWPQGAKQPKTKQLANLAGAGAMQGAFWGMLFGLIFFVPFFGLAIGAAMGALSGKFADYGIDDNFIKQTATRSPKARRRFSCCRAAQWWTRSRKRSRASSLRSSRRTCPRNRKISCAAVSACNKPTRVPVAGCRQYSFSGPHDSD